MQKKDRVGGPYEAVTLPSGCPDGQGKLFSRDGWVKLNLKNCPRIPPRGSPLWKMCWSADCIINVLLKVETGEYRLSEHWAGCDDPSLERARPRKKLSLFQGDF